MIKLVTGGYSYGKAWDHQGRTELVQIFISHDDYAIRSLQFLYSEYGKLVLSDPPDGSSIGNKFSTVSVPNFALMSAETFLSIKFSLSFLSNNVVNLDIIFSFQQDAS